MYSETVRELLEDKNIDVGDQIKADSYEGKLMPKPESGNPETLVIKLESGYNVGIKTDDIELIEKNELEESEKNEVVHSPENDDILVLHTGGTIASRVSYEKGGVKPAFDPEDLVEMYPELSEEVNIHSEVVAQMLSEDMEPEHWQEIAEKIHEVKDEYDGIIVGHGTDTMAYTGAALTLMLQNIDTGVLLVGSQRSSDRPSTDATMNMYCAGKFLSETEFEGIGICMHASSNDDECIVIPAAKARKMHTSRRDAFEPINSEEIGRINYENGKIKTRFEKEHGDYQKKTGLNKDVGFLKVRPGMNSEEIDFLIDQDYDGVIIEGTGLGHMPVNAFDDKTKHHEEILEKVSELAEDTLVVMSSQCINGRVNMNVYDAGLKIQNAGVVMAEDMHPELAYVKLMWSIGTTDSLEEAEHVFQKNVNGEINQRTPYKEQDN